MNIEREKEIRATWIVWCALILFTILHFYNISAPPNGYHQWRESDTAAISLNYYQEDCNFLHPRINQRGATSGITGSELPIYNYAGAMLYTIFGPSHAAHRLLTLLGALFALWVFFKTVLLLTKEKLLAACSALALAFSPLFFFYTYKIMPDIWMLALLLLSVWSFVRYLNDRKTMLFILSAIALILSATIKPLSLSIYLFYLVLLLRSSREKFKSFFIMAGYVCITFLPTLGWYLYARQVNEEYGSPGFYLGETLSTFYTYLVSSQFYKKLLLQWPFELWIGWPLVLFFFIGLVLLIKSKRKHGIFVWLLSCYIAFALISYHSSSHDYYTLIVLPPIAIITGAGIEKIIRWRQWGRYILIAIIVIVPAATFIRIKHRVVDVPLYYQFREATKSIIPPESLVMVEDKTTSVKLYQLNRKGWPLRGTITYNKVKEYIAEGAEYIVLEDELSAYDDSLFTLFEPDGKQIGSYYCYRVLK